MIENGDEIKARFELPVDEGTIYLNRTHPIVESLSTYVMNTSLDPLLQGVAKRCGVIRTGKVERRTTLLLVRFRYHIITIKGGRECPLLAEDSQILGFCGPPEKAEWLENGIAESLMTVEPDANITPDLASQSVQKIAEGIDFLRPKLTEAAYQRSEELLEAHRRVRTAARLRGLRYRVEPHLPPDVLGIYIYLPVA
jgi:hypothetical protein